MHQVTATVLGYQVDENLAVSFINCFISPRFRCPKIVYFSFLCGTYKYTVAIRNK